MRLPPLGRPARTRAIGVFDLPEGAHLTLAGGKELSRMRGNIVTVVQFVTN
jgi:hypothetical protein